MKLKELVNNSFVEFGWYEKGIFYYHILTNKRDVPVISLGSEEVEKWNIEYDIYTFQVRVEDIGNEILMPAGKGIKFKKWIKKSLENGTIECWVDYGK